MARIRSIHPGLLTDEAFMTLTVECPLAVALLMGLWMEADDAGTFEWKPVVLKARCLPAAPGNMGDLLEALCAVDMVRRFEVEGKPYGVIRNFVKFQRPKDPKDVHPFNDETRAYAGFVEGVRPHAGTGRKPTTPTSELLPNSPRTASGFSPQRKEVGGRMEDEGEEKAAAAAFGAQEREPAAPVVDMQEVERRCEQATGWHLTGIKAIADLVAVGVDLESRVLPILRDVAAQSKKHGKPPPDTWHYAVPIIKDQTRVPKPASKPIPMAFAIEGSETWGRLAKVKKESLLRAMLSKHHGKEGVWFNPVEYGIAQQEDAA